MTALPAADDPRWAKLAEPFAEEEIELLPKPLRKFGHNGEEMKPSTCNVPDKNGISCGGWHILPAIHLHYVGHAGVTMRLNQVDPTWRYEPMYRNVPDELMAAAIATGDASIVQQLLDNAPIRYTDEGLWIRLTVLGVTRPGFGDAAGKRGPNAVKELIGDAIRNAAMRFGVGTYLWSKSEAAAAMVAREAATDLDAEQPPRPAARRPAQQRSAQQPPQQRRPAPQPGPAEQAPPPPPPGADDAPVVVLPGEDTPLDAIDVAERMAKANTVDELGQLWGLAGKKTVLALADVTAGLNSQWIAYAREVGQLPAEDTPITLGRWAFICRAVYVKNGESIDTAAAIAAANQ